jgi:hypothetical protein
MSGFFAKPGGTELKYVLLSNNNYKTRESCLMQGEFPKMDFVSTFGEQHHLDFAKKPLNAGYG